MGMGFGDGDGVCWDSVGPSVSNPGSHFLRLIHRDMRDDRYNEM